MERNTNKDPFGSLPTELIELFCEYCDDKSVLEYLPRAAKVFSLILANDKFWQRRCVIRIPKFIENDDDRSWKYRYQKNIQYFPDVTWHDITGYSDAKEKMLEAIVFPIAFPKLFANRRVRPPVCLLYGPHGPEKMLIAQAAATRAKVPLFRVRCSDLHSAWQGEGDKKLKQLFNEAQKHAPSILFIEEIDKVDSFNDSESEASRRIKTEFLVQMYQRDATVYVLGASDNPMNICPAIRKRFERRIWVGFPDQDTRVKYLKLHLATFQHDVTDEDIAQIASIALGYSAYDISNVVSEAALMPLRALANATHFKPVTLPCTKDANHVQSCLTPCSPGDADGTPMNLKDIPNEKLYLPGITKRHLELALVIVKPSTTATELKKLIEFTKEFTYQ